MAGSAKKTEKTPKLELSELLKLLRENDVTEFPYMGGQIKFGSHANLVPSTYKPGPTPSKQDETKAADDLLFHSTPFA